MANAAGCCRHGAMRLNLAPKRMSPKPVCHPGRVRVVHRRAAGADRPPVGIDAPLRIDVAEELERSETPKPKVTRKFEMSVKASLRSQLVR